MCKYLSSQSVTGYVKLQTPKAQVLSKQNSQNTLPLRHAVVNTWLFVMPTSMCSNLKWDMAIYIATVANCNHEVSSLQITFCSISPSRHYVKCPTHHHPRQVLGTTLNCLWPKLKHLQELLLYTQLTQI